jgi:hypothetical protein
MREHFDGVDYVGMFDSNSPNVTELLKRALDDPYLTVIQLESDVPLPLITRAEILESK